MTLRCDQLTVDDTMGPPHPQTHRHSHGVIVQLQTPRDNQQSQQLAPHVESKAPSVSPSVSPCVPEAACPKCFTWPSAASLVSPSSSWFATESAVTPGVIPW